MHEDRTRRVRLEAYAAAGWREPPRSNVAVGVAECRLVPGRTRAVQQQA